MKTLNEFKGYKWWEQNNPAYREACFRQATRELVELKGKFDYFIKMTQEHKLDN